MLPTISRLTRTVLLPAAASFAVAAQTPQDATANQGKPAAPKVDAGLAAYTKVDGVSGNLKSIGSNTMAQEMTLWAEQFRKLYPNVTIEITGKGSGEAPTALIEGTAQFGPMSRPMKEKEMDDFEKKYGYKPTAIATSIDMLAVFVHKDNPLQSLTLPQIDAIFSKNRKGGADKDIKTWGDLGLTGEWADKPISLYGRDSNSGTNSYFKEHALFNGDFKDTVKEQGGASAVVQGVATDRFAIGYSGIGSKTADVRTLPIAKKDGEKAVDATADTAYSGDYPLSRQLFLYVNRKPGTDLDPLRREFLRYVLSKDGQMDVVDKGYVPLTNKLAQVQLGKIGLAAAK